MAGKYNVIAEYGFLAFALLILFLMLYTNPRKTKIYFINFLGIIISILTTSVHLLLIHLSVNPEIYSIHFFNMVCMLFLLLYVILLDLLFNYIMLLSPELSIKPGRILVMETAYSLLYIIIMYILLRLGLLYKVTPSGIHFRKLFYSYIILGILDVAYCLWTTVYNKKHLAKIIIICVYIFAPLDILLLVLQLFKPYTIFLSMTYVFPLLLFYTLFHSNPFNGTTGCQNVHSFETRFIDNIRMHRKFTIIHLKLKIIKTDGQYYNKKETEFISATKCQKIESLCHGIHIYSFSDDTFTIFTNSKHTDYIIEGIKIILDEPVEYHNSVIKMHYKMTVFGNNPYTKNIPELMKFINYMQPKFKNTYESQCIICNDQDYEDFYHQFKIENLLIDIRNKMDLDDKRVICCAQPIYSIEHGTFRTAEALMRLDMDGETIYPDKFINIAEQNGCIHSLTCIMLNKVCHMVKKLENRYDFDAITINCSTIEMSDFNLHKDLLQIIENTHADCSKIRLELTESAMVNNYEAVSSNMKILDDAGVRFYLDDFGTGYSNLERIMTFPFMTIKFDKSILYKALNDENMNEIVSSMVNIFKKRGFILLVEGVENEEHNEYSIQHGFDYIQGYKYAKPVPITELGQYFEETDFQ